MLGLADLVRLMFVLVIVTVLVAMTVSVRMSSVPVPVSVVVFVLVVLGVGIVARTRNWYVIAVGRLLKAHNGIRILALDENGLRVVVVRRLRLLLR